MKYNDRAAAGVRVMQTLPGSDGVPQETAVELRDTMISRDLKKKRERIMQTFPNGIEGIDPEPAAIWRASMMLSPDETGHPG